jgi:sporulation protein YlmC with PRC-barrel domain
MDHPRPNLRYVEAKALDDTAMKLRGLKVASNRSEDLGKVEGFIIDINTGRPYHVVVGTGGLFKHKHFLLPIGHVSLAPDSSRLTADITKDRVERIPGFDKDEFKKLSEEDLRKLEAPTVAACCPDEEVNVGVAAWETTHYAYPTWWEASYYRPDRADQSVMNIAGVPNLSSNTIPPASIPTTNDRARERVIASERLDDTSPHFDGRAQPGDVLGVETGGERTYVGDTSEDENKRRRDAEEAATKRK